MATVCTFGCLGLPQLPVVIDLLVPRDLEALEVHRGQGAAGVRPRALHAGVLPVAGTDTVGPSEKEKKKKSLPSASTHFY